MRKFYPLAVAFVLTSASALPASADAPSFNCAKATYPDERTICSSTELSQLDNIADAGYEYVRRVYGTQYAKSVTLPLLHARRSCGSNAACIKEQQLAAIQKFQSLGAPVGGPQIAQLQQLLWNHNGSTAYLIAKGNSRKFFFKEPKPEMLSAGVNPDALIFEGKADGATYQGTAYLFNSHCGRLPYQVSGLILNDYRRVELRGMAPVVDSDCRITRSTASLLAFQLIEPAPVGSTSVPNTQPSQAHVTSQPLQGAPDAHARVDDPTATFLSHLGAADPRFPWADPPPRRQPNTVTPTAPAASSVTHRRI